MKLKTRLLLSFLVVILVPLLLALVLFMLVTANKNRGSRGALNQIYFSNTVDMLMDNTSDEVERLKQWSKAFPERFLNRSILEDINKSLSSKNSFLVIRQGTRIVFDGAPDGLHPRYSSLPMYGKMSGSDVIVIELQSQSALLREVDFGNYRDLNHGQAFVITPTGALVPGAGKLFLNYILWGLVILLITALIIVSILYRSIVRKVSIMQMAADNIRHGNLDFTIDVKGHDELSELAGSMDRMKNHLRADAMRGVEDQEAQRRFLSNMTHDLKTPLTSVIGYSEALLDGIAPTPEKQMKYVATIHSKAREMNDLLNELSVFSKLDSGTVPYNFEKVNVRGFYDEFADDTMIEFSSQKYDFTYTDEIPADVDMLADPSQIKRVLHNLISNAVKYKSGERQLRVELRVKDAGKFIQTEVEDNGCGISQEDLSHVYERLFRADKARNTQISGSGIGLSIVKKIVNDHGGQVWATSTPGEGSTFYFLLKKYNTRRQEELNEQNTDN